MRCEPFTNQRLFRLYEHVRDTLNDFKTMGGDIGSGMGEACLKDKERTATLMDKVWTLTTPGQEVADLGAGSGILGLTALLREAKHVHFVDQNPYLTSMIHFLATTMGFDNDRFSVNAGDAASIALAPGTRLDHVICELIGTGLIGESQVQAVQNLVGKGYTHTGTIYTPESSVSTVELVDVHSRALTQPVPYSTVRFSSETAAGVQTSVTVRGVREGVAASALIRTELEYHDGSRTGAFKNLCKPRKALLVREDKPSWDILVEPGTQLELRIEYAFGQRQMPKVFVQAH